MRTLKVFYKDGSDEEFEDFLNVEFNGLFYTVICKNDKRYCFHFYDLKSYHELQTES